MKEILLTPTYLLPSQRRKTDIAEIYKEVHPKKNFLNKVIFFFVYIVTKNKTV